MRYPAQGAGKRANLSHYHLPAPTMGWNTRDNLSNMGPLYAVAMENIFPEESYLRRRSGFTAFSTGSANGNFHSLFEFSKGNTATTLVGITTTGRFYGSIVAGALPAASTGLGSAEATAVNVNQRLVMAFDDNATGIQDWDGTTLTATVITGATSTAMTHVNLHKNRTYLVEYNSLKFWYSATDAYAGAYTSYDLQYIAKRGGYLLCTATWTVDGGAGVDDLFVAITSNGEAVVYQGSNPGDTANWALVGIYEIPLPTGRRCAVKFGGDLLIMTKYGVVSMAGLFAEGGIFRGRADFTAAIGSGWRDLVAAAATDFAGWSGVVFKNMLIFNCPNNVTSQTGHQAVMNTTTGAWCRWTMAFRHAAVWQSRLMLGYTTAVYEGEAGAGPDVLVSWVSSYIKQAYNTLGAPGRKKLVKRVIPQFGANVTVDYTLTLDPDFNDNVHSILNNRLGGYWSATMTQSDQGLNVITQPEASGSLGNYFSVKFALLGSGTQTDQPNMRYVGMDIFYEAGGPA